eukprot:jgi/Pico_ML_1/54389/g4744.t1
MPAPWAHAALAAVGTAPLLVPVPASPNVVLTAALAVYVGAKRSVKPDPPEESMSKQDAMRFPLIGSVMLFGLFLCFKFLPKDLVNAVLAIYFVVLGAAALTATFYPFMCKLTPSTLRNWKYEWKQFKIPVLMSEPEDVTVDVPGVLVGLCSMGFCVWYYMEKHWIANNVLGLAFSIQGIEFLSLGSIQIGCILLVGLFFYDIFWVFCTPVMVSVAKSFEAPIKLLFPRFDEAAVALAKPFSMLGLGDIVIPGIFVALILRYDAHNEYRTRYFASAYFGYILGLSTTILVMLVFNAAQPALLYIVPAVLGCVGLHALIRGEFSQVFHYSEAVEEPAEKDGSKKSQ